MVADVSIVSPWLGLTIGIVFLFGAPLVYKYEPKFHKYVRDFWGLKPSSSSRIDLRRLLSSTFFLAIGILAIAGSVIRLI